MRTSTAGARLRVQCLSKRTTPSQQAYHHFARRNPAPIALTGQQIAAPRQGNYQFKQLSRAPNTTRSFSQSARRFQSWTPPVIGDRPVAIMGAGVLGRRIAATWISAGYNVISCDLNEGQRNAAAEYVEHNLGEYSHLLKEKRTPGTYKTVADTESAVKDAWLVIEALPEKLPLKVAIFAELDQKAPADAIIGSNSSSYKSSLMIDKVDPSRKNRFCNTHYQMPPQLEAIELMTCGHTEPALLDFLKQTMADTGMMPVIARKESTGFIYNRLWAAIKRETLMILEEGVSEPKEIDALFRGMWKGNDSGPCAMMDSVGLDTVAFIEDNYVQERGISPVARDYIQKNFIEKGKLGAKSGKGGLYPPGATTKANEEKGNHDNLAAPRLYFLDIGMGGNVDINHLDTAGRVLTASADGSNVRELVSGQSCPDGIDVSIEAGKIFWTNMGPSPSGNNGTVMSADLNGSNVKTLIKKGDIHTPKQIIIDHQNKKLYMCDREGLRVHRCGFDGEDHEIVMQSGDHNTDEWKDQTRWCVGISVDPKGGKFYWTQKGASKAGQGRIFRANIEMPKGETAANRSDIELLFDNLPEPIDLEFEDGKLYWTDRGEHPFGNTLNVADVTGSERSYNAIARHFNEAIGLKIDHINHHVYVTDLGGCVYRFDLDGGNKKRLYQTDGAFSGIGLAFLH